MKLKFLNTAVAGLIFSLSCLVSTANAALITTGSLSHDTDTSIVVDSLGLEWHTLDYNNIMFGDGSIDTLVNTRLAEGGDLFGWEIANQSDYFQMLTNAGATNISDDQRDPLTSELGIMAFTGLDYSTFFEMFKLGNSYNNNSLSDYYIVNQSNDTGLDEENLRWTHANQTQLKDYNADGAEKFNYSESKRMSIMLRHPFLLPET